MIAQRWWNTQRQSAASGRGRPRSPPPWCPAEPVPWQAGFAGASQWPHRPSPASPRGTTASKAMITGRFNGAASSGRHARLSTDPRHRGLANAGGATGSGSTRSGSMSRIPPCFRGAPHRPHSGLDQMTYRSHPAYRSVTRPRGTLASPSSIPATTPFAAPDAEKPLTTHGATISHSARAAGGAHR